MFKLYVLTTCEAQSWAIWGIQAVFMYVFNMLLRIKIMSNESYDVDLILRP